ncbi:hypothetical protein KC726_01120 [Candidatus Woesebacteria bacterium]|nr:hypothetical protein [Candidatus Woesebacteria bacterium]
MEKRMDQQPPQLNSMMQLTRRNFLRLFFGAGTYELMRRRLRMQATDTVFLPSMPGKEFILNFGDSLVNLFGGINFLSLKSANLPNLDNAYEQFQTLNQTLRDQIIDVCPILTSDFAPPFAIFAMAAGLLQDLPQYYWSQNIQAGINRNHGEGQADIIFVRPINVGYLPGHEMRIEPARAMLNDKGEWVASTIEYNSPTINQAIDKFVDFTYNLGISNFGSFKGRTICLFNEPDLWLFKEGRPIDFMGQNGVFNVEENIRKNIAPGKESNEDAIHPIVAAKVYLKWLRKLKENGQNATILFGGTLAPDRGHYTSQQTWASKEWLTTALEYIKEHINDPEYEGITIDDVNFHFHGYGWDFGNVTQTEEIIEGYTRFIIEKGFGKIVDRKGLILSELGNLTAHSEQENFYYISQMWSYLLYRAHDLGIQAAVHFIPWEEGINNEEVNPDTHLYHIDLDTREVTLTPAGWWYYAAAFYTLYQENPNTLHKLDGLIKRFGSGGPFT